MSAALRAWPAAEVFVAVATGHLVVAFDAGHHEHLLVLLGGLRERVEFAGVGATRHEELAGAFRGALEEGRGLNLEEVLAIEFGADGAGGLGAQLEETDVAGAAEVEEAVFEAEVFVHLVGLIVVHRERQVGTDVMDHEGLGGDFDAARGKLGVDGLGRAGADLAGDLDDGFRLQALGDFLNTVGAWIEDHLGHPFAVAEVDEGHAAEVALGVDPTHEGHGLAGVGGAEGVAGMGAFHGVVDGRNRGVWLTDGENPSQSPIGRARDRGRDRAIVSGGQDAVSGLKSPHAPPRTLGRLPAGSDASCCPSEGRDGWLPPRAD